MRCLRVRQIGSAAEFISRMEASGILNSFGYGAGIKYENVSPIIEFCRSKADHDTFRYCKFFHRIPTTNRVGRQLRALVYDEGQTRPLLMGAFELASGAYTLGSRDLFLNWQDPLKTSIKQAGLKRIWTSRQCLHCLLTISSSVASLWPLLPCRTLWSGNLSNVTDPRCLGWWQPPPQASIAQFLIASG